ncbi:hypothetical protein IIC45_00475 [Patescibacteria group bacterium]|nr:hypothetical protein [Patescibacteria group bacterium]
MEKKSPKNDLEKDAQAVDTSEYNSSGIIFSKPTPQDEGDGGLPENSKNSQQESEQEQKELAREYSSKIQPLRTYEKDLEEAKKRAGIEDGTEETPSTKKKAMEAEKSVPANLTEREQNILKRQVEQELAKSGIMPQAEKDTPGAEEDETSLKTVRTYRDDATSSIRDRNLSVVGMAAAESKKRAAQKRRLRPEHVDEPSTFLRSLTIVVVSLTLIASGVAVSTFFYKASKEGTGIAANKEITSLIFADEQKEIDISELSRAPLLEKLNSERLEVNTKLGGVVHLLLTEKGLSGLRSAASAKRFLRGVGGSIPDRLIRSLDDEFMLGVHALGENHPFLVFKTSSFENTFAGMLDWEDTMNRDLSPLFGDTLSEIATKGAPRIFIPRIFNDVIVRNNDTRILRDDRGGIALIYGFPSVDTIIVATNENTFFEVFKRLTVTKTENKEN